MEISKMSIPSREWDVTAADVSSSGVSWGAVIGGAFVTAALSLILLALGAGFELSVVSPWSNVGASAATAGSVAIVWLILTEVLASAMGGYLAGRLRTTWRTIHNDEVHFRDTANGFLVWAVAVVLTVAFLGAAATSMTNNASRADEAAGRSGAGESNGLKGQEYFVDRLFRSDRPAAESATARAEAERIFAHSMLRNEVPAEDTSYLAHLVSATTGLDRSEADQRVADVLTEARQAAASLKKATAHLLLWIFLALLMGAFCASYAATIGGRQRDHVRAI
jgi:heme/copper-type cytochrome/quinol oxidase subunit 2